MASITDLRGAYNKVLKGMYPVSSAEQANDAFEVYVLSLILQAAKNEGASIFFENNKNIFNPSHLVFRTSPGVIYSTAQDYTHAIIEFNQNLVYEAHIGIFISGLSNVLHESDVSVINSNEGKFCRRGKVHPKKSNTILSVECKFYSGNLGIRLGREFLGLTVDLGKENRFFVSNSDGKSVDRLLAKHKIEHYLGLTPLSADKEQQVIALFRAAFRQQIAKNRY